MLGRASRSWAESVSHSSAVGMNGIVVVLLLSSPSFSLLSFLQYAVR